MKKSVKEVNVERVLNADLYVMSWLKFEGNIVHYVQQDTCLLV